MASNTYSQGAQVEHQKFGKFVTSMVMGNLKRSDRQPPAEKKAVRRRKVAPATVA